METNKFQNKYRIPSARAVWHSYDGGLYFITICTKNKEHYFGKITNGAMQLSEIGKYLDLQIKNTPNLRADMNVEIPLYVIMPNHIHLILYIGDNQYNKNDVGANKFAPQRKNLASIIRGIKSITTKYARVNNITFDWQTRFHDHIIRNQKDCNNIANYIENNVAKWESDRYYKTL